MIAFTLTAIPPGVPGYALTAPAALADPAAVLPPLAAWTPRGAVPPQPAGSDGTGVRLSGNTSLVSPPVTVPAGAQALGITAASRSGAVLTVRAEALDGGPPVELATAAVPARPGALAVPATAIAGRAVRVVLDPATALGGSVEVLAAGPFTAPLPGWTVTEGVPVTGTDGGRPVVSAREEPLGLTSPPVTPGPGARHALVAARGPGVLRARAGGAAVTLRLPAAWRDVRVPVGDPALPVALEVRADPEGDEVRLRDLGLFVRSVRIGPVRVARGGRTVVVRALVGPTARALPVRITARGTTLARGRVGAAGVAVLRFRPPRARVPLLLVVDGDRTRIGATRRLPRPPAAPPVRTR